MRAQRYLTILFLFFTQIEGVAQLMPRTALFDQVTYKPSAATHSEKVLISLPKALGGAIASSTLIEATFAAHSVRLRAEPPRCAVSRRCRRAKRTSARHVRRRPATAARGPETSDTVRLQRENGVRLGRGFL